jgi:acyl carrier protein phosphodiesterase
MLAELSGNALPDVSNATATAILGWYAWHTAARTIPSIVKAFRDEMSVMRAEAREERQSLHDELASERLQRHSDHMAIVEALNELARRIPRAVDLH